MKSYLLFTQSTVSRDLISMVIDSLDKFDIWYSFRVSKAQNGKIIFCFAIEANAGTVCVVYPIIYRIEVAVMLECGAVAGNLSFFEWHSEDEIINEIMPKMLAHATVH